MRRTADERTSDTEPATTHRTYAEVAAILKTTESNCRELERRALGKLRAAIQHEARALGLTPLAWLKGADA